MAVVFEKTPKRPPEKLSDKPLGFRETMKSPRKGHLKSYPINRWPS